MDPRVDIVRLLEWRHRVVVTVFILYKDLSLIDKGLDVCRKIVCRINNRTKVIFYVKALTCRQCF